MITSNRFWTTENVLDTISLYESHICTSEEELRKSLKDSNISLPYYISTTSIIHGESDISGLEEISQHIKTTKKISLDTNQPLLFPIIRTITYYSLSNLLKQHGFDTKSHVFYISNNKAFHLRKHTKVGTFSAYRGFKPLLEDHFDIGKLALYFVEDTIFRVEEPIEDWKFWEGSLAGVRAEYRGDMDTRGGVILNEINQETGIATVQKGNIINQIPLAGIYIVGNSRNLRKAGIYQKLSNYARFKDSTSTMYDHLMDFISRFSKNNHFSVVFDIRGQNSMRFSAEINEEI